MRVPTNLSDLPMPDVPTSSVPNGAGTQLAAIAGFAATAAGYIPYILALLPAVYYCILIWESKTVQTWVAARRARKAAKTLAKLKAKTLVVAAQIDAVAEVETAKVFAAAKVDNAVVDANTLVDKVQAGVTGSSPTG